MLQAVTAVEKCIRRGSRGCKAVIVTGQGGVRRQRHSEYCRRVK
jgi:hypothetical protein